MSEAAKPRRRWFRFSLRTMFVAMALVACWLAYELNWIRQRTDFIIEQTARYVQRGGDAALPWTGAMRGTEKAPGLLWLFGESGFEALQFDVAVEHFEPDRPYDSYPEIQREKQRTLRLFPEVKQLDVEPCQIQRRQTSGS